MRFVINIFNDEDTERAINEVISTLDYEEIPYDITTLKE